MNYGRDFGHTYTSMSRTPDKFLVYPDTAQVARPLEGSISSKAPEYGQNFQSLDIVNDLARLKQGRVRPSNL